MDQIAGSGGRPVKRSRPHSKPAGQELRDELQPVANTQQHRPAEAEPEPVAAPTPGMVIESRHPSVFCSSWLAGMGCAEFLKSDGRCTKIHSRWNQGEDLIAKNMCQQYRRMRCGDSMGCPFIHATRQDIAEKMWTRAVHYAVVGGNRADDMDSPSYESSSAFDTLYSAMLGDICDGRQPEDDLHLFETWVRMLKPHMPRVAHDLQLIIDRAWDSQDFRQ
jgi:hypothetical protein